MTQQIDLNKASVPSLTPIPDDADLIVASARAREKTDDGFDAVELYAVNSKTGDLTRITHTRQAHNHFAVSYDRRYIAANRYIHGDTNGNGMLEAYDRKTLFVLDLQERKEWQILSNMDCGWGGISWGPDGFIYCSNSHLDNRLATDMYRISPDGTGFEMLTGRLETLLGHDTPGHWVSDCAVSWDGKSMAFVYHKDMSVRRSKIGWMMLDGSEARVVTNGSDLPDGMRGVWSVGDFDPEIGPDGESVCYQRVTDVGYNGGLSTGVINCSEIHGSRVWQASPSHKMASSFYIPHWGQDGQIACTELATAESFWGPAIFWPDGSDYRRIQGANFCTHVRWIPS